MNNGKSEDYTTVCLIDYDYYIKGWNIAAADLSHQAVLDSDPKATQQIEFIYIIGEDTTEQIFSVLEKKSNHFRV